MFMRFREAPRHLWAFLHEPLPPLPGYARFTIQQGYEVEKLAYDYILAYGNPNYDYRFQVKAETSDCQVRTDILAYDPDNDAYDLIEVKSGNNFKKRNYIYDLAFQKMVFSKNYRIRDTYLLTINPRYIREEKLDIHQLFMLSNVTEEVTLLVSEVEVMTQEALKILFGANLTEAHACKRPRDCPFPHLCHPGLPDYSIYDLPRMNQESLTRYASQGIIDLHDLKTSEELPINHQLILTSLRENRPVIEEKKLKQRLSELTYPLYFLDYEALGLAIPPFKQYRPYQHMVFQFSLHIIKEPDSTPIHEEFLFTQKADPTKELVDRLEGLMKNLGTVVIWNKDFESFCNKTMAKLYPEKKDFLMKMNESMFDLMKVFMDMLYIDYRFKGSASIKKVLPVVCPELTYKGMAVADGGEAMAEWYRMIFHTISDEEKKVVQDNLLRYCELDSLAMVRIYTKLREIFRHDGDGSGNTNR